MSGTTLLRDVMRPAVIAPEGMWFRELVHVMREHRVDCLVIVDAARVVTGIVTEEDLLLKIVHEWVEGRPRDPESGARRIERRKAAGLTAGELMSEPVVTADAALPAVAATRAMLERGVRHLVVVDAAGHPAGVVSRGDLLAVFLRPDEEIRQDVEDLLARVLRARAGAVAVRVEDGVVVLRRRSGEAWLSLAELAADVEEVEGVVAVRTAGGPADLAGEVLP